MKKILLLLLIIIFSSGCSLNTVKLAKLFGQEEWVAFLSERPKDSQEFWGVSTYRGFMSHGDCEDFAVKRNNDLRVSNTNQELSFNCGKNCIQEDNGITCEMFCKNGKCLENNGPSLYLRSPYIK